MLTIVLIGGMIVVAAALVMRLSAPPPQVAVAAEALLLPEGETITAVGATPSALTVATRDGAGVERLRVFDPSSGEQTGATTIRRAP